MKMQIELYSGKTPKEIDSKLLFDLPQLPEDDLYFTMLLTYRYYYYLDNEDYKNASKVLTRLISLKDYMPKVYYKNICAENLFFNCVIEKNEDLADEIMYENEKFLNSVNNSLTIRARLAYILLTKGEKDIFEAFYKKGVKEAKLQQLSGLKAFEIKLLELMKQKYN